VLQLYIRSAKHGGDKFLEIPMPRRHEVYTSKPEELSPAAGIAALLQQL
jgi:hypothetical protein